MIEDRISAVARRIDSLTEAFEELTASVAQSEDTLSRISKAISEETLRLGEAKLLRDIRDGKLTVLHTETGMPAHIAFFNV